MSSFCTVNFSKSLTNDVVSFEQLGPGFVFVKILENRLDFALVYASTGLGCLHTGYNMPQVHLTFSHYAVS